MQQSCPKTYFLRTLFQSAVTGGWSDGLSVAATRFSGTTGGIVAVRTNTAIVIPGRHGLRSHFCGYYLRCLCGYICSLDPTLRFRPSSPCLS